MIVAVASAAYGASLLLSDPPLQRPPQVAGGLWVLVDKRQRGAKMSLPVSVGAPEDHHPRVTVHVDVSRAAALVLSGDMLPNGRVSYIPADEPSGDPALPSASPSEQASGTRVLESRPATVVATSSGSSDQLGSLEDVRRGDARASIPGLTSGARAVFVPVGSGFLSWELRHSLLAQGRGSDAGAVPAIGTPNEAIIVGNLLRSALYQPVFKGGNQGLSSLPPDKRASFEQMSRQVEQRVGALNELGPAYDALEAEVNVPGTAADLPLGLAYRFLINSKGSWYVPLRLRTALTVGSLAEGQKLDSAVPAVAGRGDELTWLSPTRNGQIPNVTWTSSDPATQQRSGDRFFIAALLLGVLITVGLELLKKLTESK